MDKDNIIYNGSTTYIGCTFFDTGGDQDYRYWENFIEEQAKLFSQSVDAQIMAGPGTFPVKKKSKLRSNSDWRRGMKILDE